MHLKFFPLIGIAFVLNACVDEGVIGDKATGGSTSTTDMGGNSSTTLTLAGGNAGTANGGTSNAAVTTSGGTTTAGGSAGASSGGAGGQSPEEVMLAATMTGCGINPNGATSNVAMSIPSDPATATPAALWGAMLDACSAGGWDLMSCAGTDVIASSVTTDQAVATSANPTLRESFVVLTQGNKVCCAYEAFNQPGGFTPAVCGPKSLARQTMTRCTIPVAGEAVIQNLDVPTDLTGPNWGQKATACQQGGWDLSLCAGATATFTTFPTGTSSSGGNPRAAWVVTTGSQVCCVYETDQTNGGVYSKACSS